MHEITFLSNKGPVTIDNLPVAVETWTELIKGKEVFYIAVTSSDDMGKLPYGTLDDVRDNVLAPVFGTDARYTYGGWFIDNWRRHRSRNVTP